MPALEVYCNHGFDQATCYIWQSKYSAMEAADIHRMKYLEEDCQLKQKMIIFLLETICFVKPPKTC